MTKRAQIRLNQVVEIFKTKKPKTVGEMLKLGIKLRGMDSGVFRKVYKVTGAPLVVKIPQHTGGSCKRHAVAENRAINKINKTVSLEGLRKFMPVVYYFDNDTGIAVVHYYKPIVPYGARSMVSNLIHQLIIMIWPYAINGRSVDMHSGNIAVDPDTNQPKIIDLGYFSNYGKGY
jgi:hypothetical protein